MSKDKAIFAAGCFWGVEEFFSKIDGVISTKVGYSGGNTNNPTYEEVCRDNTGHAECILINFDTNTISYKTLLKYFWKCHDPTILNRQGKDIGTQYRSAIFYFDKKQEIIALNSKKEASLNYENSIVTEINKAYKFFDAEDYHQEYLKKNY